MQELFDDINAIRRGIEALQKRTQELGPPVTRAELDKLVATVQAQAQPTINLDGAQVAKRIQGHLATPETLGAVLTAGTAQLGAVVDRIPRTVPIEGEVFGFTSWKAAALVAGVPLVLVLLGMLFAGHFSRVPKAELEAVQAKLEAVQAENADTRHKNARLVEMARFYQDQVKAYRKKFPKAAHYFPAYTLPVASATK